MNARGSVPFPRGLGRIILTPAWTAAHSPHRGPARAGPTARQAAGSDHYATSFDDALPDDPAARYAEADARLGECLSAARERAEDPLVVFPDPYGTFFTPGGVVAEVVALEHELLQPDHLAGPTALIPADLSS
jgi:hypothetical protein